MSSYGSTGDRQASPDSGPCEYLVESSPSGRGENHYTVHAALTERRRLEAMGNAPLGFWTAYKVTPSGAIFAIGDDGVAFGEDLRKW